MIIARDVHDVPSNWSSKEDFEFYLDKIVSSQPLCISGWDTYQEMKKSVRKDSIYSKLNTIVVDMRRSFSENKFVFHEDNKNHIYTNFTKETLLQDVSFYSKYFNNETVFVLGGSSLYSMFLPFYDVFFLTIEENIYFEKGISLFPNCKTLQDAERILSDNGLFFDNMKILAINAKVYEFRRNKVIS